MLLFAAAFVLLTVPLFAACWLFSGSFRGAVRGWAEQVLVVACLMGAGAVLAAGSVLVELLT